MVFYGAFLDVVRKRNSSGSVGVPGTSSPTEITTGLSVSCHVKLSSFVTSQNLCFLLPKMLVVIQIFVF